MPTLDGIRPSDAAIIQSWQLALGKHSPATLKTYRSQIRKYAAWLAAERPDVDLLAATRTDCRSYMADLERSGMQGGTRRTAWVALKAFYRWATDEDEVDDNPMNRVVTPAVNDTMPRVLTDDELSTLLASMKGKEFAERRDLALIRLMLATGLRATEAATLRVGDVDLVNRLVVVMGKGGKQRIARFDQATAAALDRYLRARGRYPRASSPQLWLSTRGPISGSTLWSIVKRRAERAGIGHAHPHTLRHTFAHRLKSKGAADEVVMALGGWENAGVMRRYGRSVAVDRALAAYDAADPMAGL